jgi:hypothetical protein
MLRRKSKKGLVYLFVSHNGIDGPAYKYGCTSASDVSRRLSRLNNRFRGVYNFEVCAVVKSDDIFNDENKIKWGLLEGGISAMAELFEAPSEDLEKIKARFLEILNHCEIEL